MTRRILNFNLLALCLLLGGCASGPAPVPVADGLDGVEFKEHSPTQWSVWLEMQEDKLQPQKDANLCWASVVRVIRLHTAGESLEQEQIYARYLWTLPDNDRKAGYESEIVEAMAGVPRETFGHRYVVDLVNHANLSDRDIILSLSAGEPVLVGFGSLNPTQPGHICVLYGVKYSEIDKSFLESSWDSVRNVGLDAVDLAASLIDDEQSIDDKDGVEQSAARIGEVSAEIVGHQYRIDKVYYWDPWNEKFNQGRALTGGLKSLSGEAFSEQTRFAISQVSARAIIEERMLWVEDQGLSSTGVYVRNPVTRSGKPVGDYDVDNFDPELLNSLMAQFGLATDDQRDSAKPLIPQDGDSPEK